MRFVVGVLGDSSVFVIAAQSHLASTYCFLVAVRGPLHLPEAHASCSDYTAENTRRTGMLYDFVLSLS